MRKQIGIFLLVTLLSLFIGVLPVLAGPGPSPSRVDIDEEILEDDPDFLENPPVFQLKSYTVYPRLQRHKYDKTLKVIKFKAVFEYTGDTLTPDIAERPVIGTAMCKVPDPYYFHEQEIVYKGPLPLDSGALVNVTVLIPFPNKFANQLRKTPATCGIGANDGNEFPLFYYFEVKRIGREFKMIFKGSNEDDTPSLEEPTQEPVPAPSDSPTSPILKAPPAVTAEDHSHGSENAPITLIEYSDPECPFCQRFQPTMKKILDEYDGKVRWIYRHFPLSFHKGAQKKAEASECANELGGAQAFWNFIDRVLETNPEVDELPKVASAIGLNEQAFISCFQSHKYKKFVEEQMAGGMAAGVDGTPTTFLLGPNGLAEKIVGAQPYETVSRVIENALKR